MVPAACAFLAGCCALLLLAELPGGEVVAAAVALATAVGARAACLARPRACAGIRGGVVGRFRTVEREARPVARGPHGNGPRHSRLRAAVTLRGRALPASLLSRRLEYRRIVELTWYEPEWQPLPAERLELDVRLRRPRGFSNPGGMDQEARLLREGIGATGYIRTASRDGRRWRDVLRRPVLVARGEIYDAHPRRARRATRDRDRRGPGRRLAGCAQPGAMACAGPQRNQSPDGHIGHAHRHARGGRRVGGGARAALAAAAWRARHAA